MAKSKTITITEDEWSILEDFILTDASDMLDLARAIEESCDSDEEDSLENKAEAAFDLKQEIAERFNK